MRIQTVADVLEDKLNLRELPVTTDAREVPSREEMLGITILPRKNFKLEVKSLIAKFRYWGDVIKNTEESNVIMRQEAYSNQHEIGAALSKIEERVDAYESMSRLKDKITPSGRLIKRVLFSGFLASIGYGVFSLGASCISNRNARSDYRGRFETAISAIDIESAREIIAELKNRKLFDSSKIGELEKRVYNLTEEGMLEKVKSSAGEERAQTATNYLKVYKDGEHKEEVLKRLVDVRATELFASLDSNILYERTFDVIAELGQIPRKYPEAAAILGIISRKELGAKTESYIDKLEFFAQQHDSNFKLGDKVLINGSARKANHWVDEYFRERSFVIQDGSIGEVIGFALGCYSDSIVVRAADKKDNAVWKSEWDGLSDYWKYNGTKNIAGYLPYELISIRPIGEVQKNRFVREMQDLCNLLPDN